MCCHINTGLQGFQPYSAPLGSSLHEQSEMMNMIKIKHSQCEFPQLNVNSCNWSTVSGLFLHILCFPVLKWLIKLKSVNIKTKNSFIFYLLVSLMRNN